MRSASSGPAEITLEEQVGADRPDFLVSAALLAPVVLVMALIHNLVASR